MTTVVALWRFLAYVVAGMAIGAGILVLDLMMYVAILGRYNPHGLSIMRGELDYRLLLGVPTCLGMVIGGVSGVCIALLRWPRDARFPLLHFVLIMLVSAAGLSFLANLLSIASSNVDFCLGGLLLEAAVAWAAALLLR